MGGRRRAEVTTTVLEIRTTRDYHLNTISRKESAITALPPDKERERARTQIISDFKAVVGGKESGFAKKAREEWKERKRNCEWEWPRRSDTTTTTTGRRERGSLPVKLDTCCLPRRLSLSLSSAIPLSPAFTTTMRLARLKILMGIMRACWNCCPPASPMCKRMTSFCSKWRKLKVKETQKVNRVHASTTVCKHVSTLSSPFLLLIFISWRCMHTHDLGFCSPLTLSNIMQLSSSIVTLF